MAVTALDPKTALVVIDLQNGIVSLPTAHSVGEVVKQASSLADAFRNHALPVVLVNVAGGAPGRTEQARRIGDFPAGWTDLVPELNQQPEDHTITKRTWGAFTHTDLDAYLKNQGVTQVVIVGVSTSVVKGACGGERLGDFVASTSLSRASPVFEAITARVRRLLTFLKV